MRFILPSLVFALAPALALAQPADDDPLPPEQPTTPPVIVVNPSPPAPSPVVTTQVVAPTEETETDIWNAPVFASGALVFGASYGASVIAAATSDRHEDHRLYVPVVGPWLDLADRPSCDVGNVSCDHETTAKVLLVADGIFQAAGVATMVGGVLSPSHHVVTRRYAAKTRVVPTSYAGTGVGLNVTGGW